MADFFFRPDSNEKYRYLIAPAGSFQVGGVDPGTKLGQVLRLPGDEPQDTDWDALAPWIDLGLGIGYPTSYDNSLHVQIKMDDGIQGVVRMLGDIGQIDGPYFDLAYVNLEGAKSGRFAVLNRCRVVGLSFPNNILDFGFTAEHYYKIGRDESLIGGNDKQWQDRWEEDGPS